jgi:hypothetical protein
VRLLNRCFVTFQSYVIENDFLMNFESNKEHDINVDDENEMKCYPKHNNRMPYEKIESEIRKNKQWPPITEVNETLGNGNAQHHAVDSTDARPASASASNSINNSVNHQNGDLDASSSTKAARRNNTTKKAEETTSV